MTRNSPEVFGIDAQKALQARAFDLWCLLREDPRFFSHGRAIGISGDTDATTDMQIALARVQGVGPANGVPADQLAARTARLAGAGLQTDSFVQWSGGDAAFDAARAVLSDRHLPADLRMGEVDPASDGATLAALDRLTQACGVLLPMGPFIRGIERPAVCLYAADANGQPVAVAAAVAQFAPGHPDARIAWWGMLSTDPAHRGQGLALILGAQAMLRMADRHGIAGVQTGIRAGNAPSEALCTKLGLHPNGTHDLIAIDPAAFGENRLTK